MKPRTIAKIIVGIAAFFATFGILLAIFDTAPEKKDQIALIPSDQ